MATDGRRLAKLRVHLAAHAAPAAAPASVGVAATDTHPTWLELDGAALRANVAICREASGREKAIGAVRGARLNPLGLF